MKTFRADVHPVFAEDFERVKAILAPSRVGDVFFAAFMTRLVIHALEMV
jgi:hypothetical protein